ncbi:hypothetical protein MKX01_038988 [Papaver californicum]|nr:hypothetical protein MKX01_038988 [Papaver californicum]
MKTENMDVDFTEYRISSELTGHEDDVRGICVCGEAGIATSSRDKTIRFWSIDPTEKNKCKESKIMLGHTSFVGPLNWIAPDEDFPAGRIVSGGMDTLVLLWDLKTGESIQTMKGHQLQVTGVAGDDVSDIVSVSVGGTIRRWRNGQQSESWEAHKSAVQGVIKLPTGELITGSSDSTLKLWRGKTCAHTFVGHTDTVRGLAVMPGLGVLSASHDSSIRFWALTGQVLMEMVGHTSIIYSVHAHSSGLIVSGSEDGFAKIWRDGVVRIWTAHNDRIADPVDIEAFTTRLSMYKCSRKRVGGLKLEELPGLDSLHTPGTADGQTKIVREGDNGVAYSWNSREQIWDKIGEVVDGPEDGLKRPVLNRTQYDFVFDVDIGDGEPIRKLPYNRSDSPYDVADKWLLKESLPLSYRQQIVDFILQNSGQNNFTFDASFRDPYTVSNAYVPGASSNVSGGATKPVFKHIPKKGMLFFDVAQFDGILKKITEFNCALLSDPAQKDLALTEIEMSRLSAVKKILQDTSHYHTSTFADVDIALLLKTLKCWPVAMMFPVMDVLRMIILHPDGARLLQQYIKVGNDFLMETIKKVTTAPALAGNLLTSTRVVTNLFKQSSFHEWLQGNRSEVLDVFSSCCSSSNKNVQLSYSTLILNYAVLLIEKKDQEGQSQVLSAAIEIAEGSVDVDSKFRALVAVGSLMLEGLVKGIAIDFDVQSIAKVAKASKEVKIVEVASDIGLLTT